MKNFLSPVNQLQNRNLAAKPRSSATDIGDGTNLKQSVMTPDEREAWIAQRFPERF